MNEISLGLKIYMAAWDALNSSPPLPESIYRRLLGVPAARGSAEGVDGVGV